MAGRPPVVSAIVLLLFSGSTHAEQTAQTFFANAQVLEVTPLLRTQPEPENWRCSRLKRPPEKLLPEPVKNVLSRLRGCNEQTHVTNAGYHVRLKFADEVFDARTADRPHDTVPIAVRVSALPGSQSAAENPSAVSDERN